ncbi:MAG: 4Fe-4S binding protein [Bacteroides sp.]|nr:4Fe-4S binding protein [Bacteroides sp.]
MKVEKVHLITFSPTHTSQQIGEAIVRGVGEDNVEIADLTLAPLPAPLEIAAETLTVIAVPVYGGKVAPLAMQRLETVSSAGGPAALVVVYGNRAYETALTQLDAWACRKGFKVIAGGTFIGEHSYCTPEHPIAVGRPDADDLAFAEAFGRSVAGKIAAATDMEHLYGVDVSRIPRPKQPIWPMLKFIYRIAKWRKSGAVFPRMPQTDAGRCTHCGLCVKSCPNAAIVEGDECNTIQERCTRCCACVKCCPRQARRFDTPFAPLLSANFNRPKANKTIL